MAVLTTSTVSVCLRFPRTRRSLGCTSVDDVAAQSRRPSLVIVFLCLRAQVSELRFCAVALLPHPPSISASIGVMTLSASPLFFGSFWKHGWSKSERAQIIVCLPGRAARGAAGGAHTPPCGTGVADLASGSLFQTAKGSAVRPSAGALQRATCLLEPAASEVARPGAAADGQVTRVNSTLISAFPTSASTSQHVHATFQVDFTQRHTLFQTCPWILCLGVVRVSHAVDVHSCRVRLRPLHPQPCLLHPP